LYEKETESIQLTVVEIDRTFPKSSKGKRRKKLLTPQKVLGNGYLIRAGIVEPVGQGEDKTAEKGLFN